MSVQQPSGGQVIWLLVLLYWSIATFAWQWRNPTANPLTGIRYIGNVIAFDKLDDFQVPSSEGRGGFIKASNVTR